MIESKEEIIESENIDINQNELNNRTSELEEENINKNLIKARLNNQNNLNSNKKNKTTQLFETLLGSKLILTENSNMIIEKPFTIFEILSIIRSKVELEVKMEIIEKLKLIISKLHSNAIIINEKSKLKDSKSALNISFINELIEILIENSREPKLIEELLNLLEILIKKSGAQAEYFWNIFEKMSNLCEKNKSNYDGTKFLLLLKIINKFFTKSINDDVNNPSKFFFFNNNTSEIKLDSDILQSKNISLNNGFTFGIWVYPEKVNIDSTNKNISPNSTLFYINTNKNFIIEATIENDKLYYFCGDNNTNKENNIEEENNKEEESKENNENDNKNVDDKNNKNDEEAKLLESKKNDSKVGKDNIERKYLCDIEYNKWTLLLFTHKPVGFLQKPQFILYKNRLNDPIIIDYEYPTFGNQKINKFGICKGFTGLISNVFMFNQALVNPKIIEELINYKFGLYNEQNINIFKSYIEKKELNDKSNSEKNKLFQMFKEFFKSIIFIYSPCRVKNNNLCMDLVNNINAELNINKELNLIGGFYSGNNYNNDIYHLGGVSIFLPIYEYIFSSNYNSSIILEEGIQILINIFRNQGLYIGNQVKEDKHFFRNIYYLIDKSSNINNININENNNLFTKEIMLKFYELAVILINNDKQKKFAESFFDNIFLNPKIIRLYSFSVQRELYKKLKEIYMENCEYLYSIFDVKDILRTIIDLYDNDANYYCCEKHYKMFGEDNIYNLNYPEKRNKIYNPNLLNKIYDLLEIMKYILTNDKIITISQIKNIIIILITEISPCLQLSLIKLLQIIFNLNKIINIESQDKVSKFIISMEKEYIKAFHDINGIEHLLYVMSTSTLDVRYECLRLFYLICCSNSWNEKKKSNIDNEILPYICVNIFQINGKLLIRNNNIKNSKINNENNNEFDINGILFTGREEKNNNDNIDINDDNIKNNINSNEELFKLKKLNSLRYSENEINNEKEIKKEEEEEIKNDEFIEISKIVKELSLPINYIKNYSNKINDNYAERIYSFLIQWLINRFDNPIILDDDDEIYYETILIIIMNFVTNNGLILKSKFLRDLYTLSHYNLKNCKIILENKYFHQWLLDTLLIYQILYNNGYKDKTISQQGICESILHLAIKLHNLIIINATLYQHDVEQENNNSSINNYTYAFQFLITWLYKIKKIGKTEFNSAYKLINNIISDLINRLKPMLTKENILQNSLIWTCFLNIFLIAYEFYYIHDYCLNKNYIPENNDEDIDTKNNKNIEFCFVLNDEVLYNIENSYSPEIINHNKILLYFYECLKIMWDQETNEINIDDDINSNYHSIDSFLETKIFAQNLNEYSLEMNILLYSTEDLPFQDTKTHSIMKTILNIIILFIKGNKNKEDEIYWIKELKRYLIYLLIISHNINPQDTSIITDEFIERMQENICSVFIISLNFINNELKKGEEENNNNKTEVIEEYAKLFRILFISYILIIEKIIIEKEKEKNNNGGFWYGIITALGALKNLVWKSLGNSYEYSPFSIIYKNLFLTSKNELLFNLTDIFQFKTNNFFEAFQKIKSNEEWKYALFENPNVADIINNQFSLNYYEKNTKLRISNGDIIHIYDNIYINEKKYIDNENKLIVDIVNKSLKNVIKGINKTIFSNLLNIKKSQNEMRNLHKKYFNWKGKWVNLKDYINQVNRGEIKFKLGNHYTDNFLCTCLFSIDIILDYLPNFNKFDAKKNLFLNEVKENENDNDNINNMNENNNEEENDIKDYSNIKIIRTTNKGNLFNIYDNNDDDKDEDDNISNESENNNKNDIEDILFTKENYDNYNEIQKLLQFYYKSNSKNCIIDLTNLYIEKLLNSDNKEKKPNKIYYNCCLVKLKGHIPGCVLCTNNYIYFIINYNFGKKQAKNEKCIGSLFCFDPNKHKLIRKIIKKDIKQIFKKRYYYVEDSLEIFTYSNKSYYLKFDTKKDREDFYQYIINMKDISLLKEDVLSITKKWEHWDISTLTFLSFLNNFGSRSFKDLTQYPVFPWIIKDYESKKLNAFNETNIRELQKPIGALGNKQRISCFMQNYNESKELELSNQEKNNKEKKKKNKNEEKDNLFETNQIVEKDENKNDSDSKIIELYEKRYFYSSHYSNPFYVVHYMYKIFPYCCCAIELQGDGFDKRERQFISIIESWKNCMNENTDVRELIPEFYFLPEMFVNLNKINFWENEKISEKKNNNPNLSQDFEYPKWSKNNNNLFIIKNRLALESDFVSENLNDWIDLIFGYKQKGVEAEKATNLFFDFTYEGSIDINKYKNKPNLDEYNSLISKVDIGQTPSQIFSKNVEKRLKRKEVTIKKIMNLEKISKLQSHSSQSEKINSISYNSSIKELTKKMLIYIKALKNRRIICVFNNGIIIFLKEEYTLFSESGLVFIHEKTIKIPSDLLNNRINASQSLPYIIEEDFDIMTQIDKEQPITSIKNGKYVIKGGFYDSKFMIFETFHVYSNKHNYIFLDDEAQITIIKTENENERNLYVGTANGKLFIYKINLKTEVLSEILKYDKVLTDHSNSINDIYIDIKLNILATISSDKTCNLYTYPNLKLYRVILLNKVTSLDNVFISNMPLPSVIIYSKNDSLFNVYTINGSFILKKKNMFKEIYSPKISKDVYGRDYLIYGTKYKVIVICRLPLFTKEECIEIQNDNYNFPIKCLELREESEIIYFWRLHNYNLSYLKNKIVNINKNDDINLYI